MKPIHQMNRLEALYHFLTRAVKIEKELWQIYIDLKHCEERWPGKFTDQVWQAFSEWKVAQMKIESIRRQRDEETAK